MARFENKYMKRVFNKDNGSDVFYPERGKPFDLSDVKLLYSGVDTIRQLFVCNLKQDLLQNFEKWREDVVRSVFIDDYQFSFSSSGKKSGYQYILKNLDLGFVVLVKSFYCDAEERGSHIKVEATPQIIDELGLVGVSNRIREIASLFGDTLEASGVAVHLFTDIKGLKLDDDFEQKLATRSKRNLKVNGISKSHFEAASASFVYGQGQTYLFGLSSSLQMCLYNKSLEAIKSDKLGFCESVWKRTPSLDDCFKPEYDDGSVTGEADTVHRLEFRIHHSIIREFENGHFNQSGNAICIREAKDLINHLGGLWRYCLENFRYQESRTYVHPLWQKLIEDVNSFNIHDSFVYKRAQKKSTVNTRRNVGCYMGNYLRLAARRNYSAGLCVKHFMEASLERELCDYFGLLQFKDDGDLERLLYEFCESRLTEHRLNGVAA